MSASFWSRLVFAFPLILACATQAIANSVPPPYNLKPFNTSGAGNSAGNYSGFFRQNGGPATFRYFIGTNLIPGSLILDFDSPFTDGPNNDFAISTSSEAWGPLADVALFQFYLGSNLEASFIAHLAPDQLFEFDLPGSDLVVNRVIVTNITPDSPGIDNMESMTFDDAGAAYPSDSRQLVPEPSDMVLVGTGLLGVLWLARRKLFYCRVPHVSRLSKRGIPRTFLFGFSKI